LIFINVYRVNIHYYFSSEIAFSNYCQNIKKFLKQDGYLLITTFDGNLINAAFDNTGHITGSYTNDSGIVTDVYDINRLYSADTKDIKKYGLPIDVLMKWSRNEYVSEYLVSPEFLIEELGKKANMKLVETELFGTFYELNKEFLEKSVLDESSPTRKWFLRVKEFYNKELNINICTMKYAKLTRYYIFKKIE
jgi:hypothetical protein